MTLSSIIYRVINNKSHILNCINGSLMSFDIREKDVLRLIKNFSKYKYDVEDDVRKLLVREKGTINSRLCRSRLIELGMHFSFPTIVNIELNSKCNLRCIHCYLGEDNLSGANNSFFEDMTILQINDLLNSFRELGVFLIVLTGGEPFLNKNIKNFLRFATEKGFIIEIFSNLQQLPNWFLRAKLNEFRIGRIQTSIYSSDSNIHESVTKVKGSYKRTVKNLHLLKKKGYYLEVATPLMKINYDTRRETANYFKSMQIRQDFSWPIVNEYHYPLSKKALLNVSEEQFKQFVSENPDFLIQINMSNRNDSICAAGKAIFGLTNDGDVLPCSQYPLVIENIRNKAIKDILNSNTMQKIADYKKTQIKHDSVYNYCIGTNYAETKNSFKQPNYMIKAIKKCIES